MNMPPLSDVFFRGSLFCFRLSNMGVLLFVNAWFKFFEAWIFSSVFVWSARAWRFLGGDKNLWWRSVGGSIDNKNATSVCCLYSRHIYDLMVIVLNKRERIEGISTYLVDADINKGIRLLRRTRRGEKAFLVCVHIGVAVTAVMIADQVRKRIRIRVKAATIFLRKNC